MKKHLQHLIPTMVNHTLILIIGLFFVTHLIGTAHAASISDFFSFSHWSKLLPHTSFQPTPSFQPPTDDQAAGGIGSVADNLMGPVRVIADFIADAAIVIGMSCLFAGFIRYLQHRSNPLAHPIGIVVTLVLLGTLLLCLPVMYKLTGNNALFGNLF